jgi:hypothetical protein
MQSSFTKADLAAACTPWPSGGRFFMQRFLITMEQKLGWLAIPGLLRYIMFLQAIVFVMLNIEEGQSSFAEKLLFSISHIQHGEVWRCLSFYLIPTGRGFLWLLMGVSFMIWVADLIEHAWGSFRLNLYLLCSALCINVHSFMTGYESVNAFFIFEGLVMAFAIYVPEVEIRLYGVIPLKMKWIGVMAAGHVCFIFMGGDSGQRGHIFASLLPFLVVFGPGLVQFTRNYAKNQQRRQRFASSQRSEDEALSTCHLCGRTDISHPQLDFRVTTEGHDVCNECRQKSAAST